MHHSVVCRVVPPFIYDETGEMDKNWLETRNIAPYLKKGGPSDSLLIHCTYTGTAVNDVISRSCRGWILKTPAHLPSNRPLPLLQATWGVTLWFHLQPVRIPRLCRSGLRVSSSGPAAQFGQFLFLQPPRAHRRAVLHLSESSAEEQCDGRHVPDLSCIPAAAVCAVIPACCSLSPQSEKTQSVPLPVRTHLTCVLLNWDVVGGV